MFRQAQHDKGKLKFSPVTGTHSKLIIPPPYVFKKITISNAYLYKYTHAYTYEYTRTRARAGTIYIRRIEYTIF